MLIRLPTKNQTYIELIIINYIFESELLHFLTEPFFFYITAYYTVYRQFTLNSHLCFI